MEQLNYRFLNYKHYNSFLNDLNDEKIRQDSIVFIQDKPCIWARGKEYVCDGPNTADIQNGTFTFKNGKDEIIFSASQKDGVMTLTDGNGNVVSQEYVLKDWFDSTYSTIRQSIQSNTSSINSLNDNYINLARDKQNKLTAGENIRIKDNVISAVVDTDLYVITQSLDGIENPNPNKIYLLETVDQDDKVTYQQYKYQDGEWISVGVADTNINMSEYLEQEYRYLQENYQPKGDYANKAWTEDTFVKKTSIDESLSTTSSNPVENRTVAIALQNKADNTALLQYAKKSDIVDKVNSSALNDYVTNIQHAQDLNSKQNLLTAGNGISINNNQISVTLDTDFMVVIRSLESVLNPNPNKIYLLEHTEDENTVYTEYRYNADNSEWIEIGRKDPEINLEPYMTKVEAQAIHQNIIDNYLTKAEAEANYQTIIDDYVTKDELEQFDQKLEDYASKAWVEEAFVKNTNVYTPQDGISDGEPESGGGSSGTIPSGNSNITVDKNLSTISSNPVENRTITIALQGKVDNSQLQQYAKKSDIINKVDASVLNNYVTNIQYQKDLEDKQGKLIAGDGISISQDGRISAVVNVDKNLNSLSTNPVENKVVTTELQKKADSSQLQQYAKKLEIVNKVDASTLNNYVTKVQHQQDLENKQKKLTAGDGISISSDGKISVTLDTDFMVITRSLQGITNPNPNKIYLLEHEVDGEISYTEYRYDGDSQEWIEVGEKAPKINLEPYMTKAEAQIAHQNITDNYLSKAEAQSTYQTIINDYVTKDKFEDAIDNITESEDTISLNLTSLQQEISDVDSKINTEIADRETAINSIQNNKQNKLTAGEGIDITNNVISVDDYIGERDINGKLNTLQQMLGQIYVLKRDVSTPDGQWSEAPIYSFGDLPSSGGQETPSKSDILVLNQNAFNTLEQNNELRNDVCYLITD